MTASSSGSDGPQAEDAGAADDPVRAATDMAASGRRLEALALLDRLVAAEPDPADPLASRRLRSRARAYRGALNFEGGGWHEALPDLLQAVPDLDDPRDLRQRHNVLMLLAVMATRLELYDDAHTWTRAALDLALTHPDTELRMRSHSGLGVICGFVGDVEGADRHSLEALGLALERGVPLHIGIHLCNLLMAANQTVDRLEDEGRVDEARRVLEWVTRHVRHGERVIDAARLPIGLFWRNNRAGWLLRRGDTAEAGREWRALLPAAQDGAYVDTVRLAWYGLGRVAMAEDDPQAALQAFAACTAASAQRDAYAVVERAHQATAAVLRRLGREDEARAEALVADRLREAREHQRVAAQRLLSAVEADVQELRVESQRRRMQAAGLPLPVRRGRPGPPDPARGSDDD